QVRVERVFLDGGLPDFPGITLGDGNPGPIIWAEPYYVVIWSPDRGALSMSRVAVDGGVIDLPALPLTPVASASQASVTKSGDDLFVACVEGLPPHLQGEWVWSDAGVSSDGGFSLSPSAGSQGFPSVASNGSQILAVWQDDVTGAPQIWAALVLIDGGIAPV